MLPMILMFGGIALLISLSSGKAHGASKQAPTPSNVVKDLPPMMQFKLLKKGCSPEDTRFIADVVAAMGKGSATLDMMQKAHKLAENCMPETAAAIKDQLSKALLAARARAEQDPSKQLAALITSPDSPPSPIPNDPKSGKALWKIVTKKGNTMAIPNFTPVLNLFKKLQSIVGAKQDGRIGNETITKFRNLAKSKGYLKAPTSPASLAANTAKYIAVLTQNIPSNQVGARGGSADRSPFPGC